MQTPPRCPRTSSRTRRRRGGSSIARSPKGGSGSSEPEAKAVLEAYRIPVVADANRRRSADGGRAPRAAIAGQVALKILSPDITHKSDVGGVVLDLRAPSAVRDAAEAMLERVRQRAAGGAHRGVHRAADGGASGRLRADRRRQRGSAVRPGDPVRPRRHRRRNHRRHRARAAAAQHAPRARGDGAHPACSACCRASAAGRPPRSTRSR